MASSKSDQPSTSSKSTSAESPSLSIASAGSSIIPQDHHQQSEFCYTRTPYRQGKEFKAVKVYTINDESKHMLLQNIPIVGLAEELKTLCRKYGTVMEFRNLPAEEYPPKSQFTTVFYVKYESVRQARFAKTKLDNRAFYGETIHICYAPELESVADTREKLRQRGAFVQSYRSRKRKR